MNVRTMNNLLIPVKTLSRELGNGLGRHILSKDCVGALHQSSVHSLFYRNIFRIMKYKRHYCQDVNLASGDKLDENNSSTSKAKKSTAKTDLTTEKPNITLKVKPEKNQSEEAWRSINPAATKEVKLFYFDTLTLANKLHGAGFTRDQAVYVVEAFIEVLNTSIEHQTKHMVTKPEQEIMMQQLLAQIATVKKDMVILEKSEFTMLRNENEKQTSEIKQIKSHIQDEISKLQGNVKLDVNLERSRATEAHANNEKQLQIIRNKIDTDVANLKTIYEQYRNDVIRTCLGTVVSCAAIMIAVMRLMG